MRYNKIRKMDIADGPGVRDAHLIVKNALIQKRMILMVVKNLQTKQ